MFGNNKKVSQRDDGAKVIETKNKTRVKYPNGDFEVHNKKTGESASWSLTRPDGKRERDGK